MKINREWGAIRWKILDIHKILVNKKLVERLISKSNIDVTDYVIEIGPGKGIITDVLSQHAGEVVAVEYDQELYNNLVRYHSHDNVTYIFGDF